MCGKGEDPKNGPGAGPSERPSSQLNGPIPAVALLPAEAHRSGSPLESARPTTGRAVVLLNPCSSVSIRGSRPRPPDPPGPVPRVRPTLDRPGPIGRQAV